MRSGLRLFGHVYATKYHPTHAHVCEERLKPPQAPYILSAIAERFSYCFFLLECGIVEWLLRRLNDGCEAMPEFILTMIGEVIANWT